MFFDTHTHLNDEVYKDSLDQVINRALDNKVSKMVVVGYDLVSSLEAVRIASKYEFIYAAVGIHPNSKEELNDKTLLELEKLLTNKKVVAVGEIGLDYYRDKSYIEKQQDFFSKQIKLAYKHNKAIIIHSRDAGQDTLKILKENKEKIKRGIMHCYTYSKELSKEFLKLNLKISFAGSLTFLNAKKTKEIAEVLDLKDLLIETDCPYLAPHPYRGKQNEPSYLVLTAKELAKLKKISIEELAEQTTKTACEVFLIEK